MAEEVALEFELELDLDVARTLGRRMLKPGEELVMQPTLRLVA